MSTVQRDPMRVPVTGQIRQTAESANSAANERSSPRVRDETTVDSVDTPHMRHADSDASEDDHDDPPPNAPARPGIEDIIRDHSAAMYRVAASVVRDHALAEDVVQESVVKAWQALDTFRGDASIRTWLLRITHNTAISALRKRRDDVMAPSELPERPGQLTVEDAALLQADRDEIWVALSKLDPVGRAIIVLREVERMSYDEIADVLELPPATVRTRLFRARQQLVRTSSAREAFAARGEGTIASNDAIDAIDAIGVARKGGAA